MITLKEVRARFAHDHGLPFADSLSEQNILNALNEHGIKYRDRVFTPVTTIWGFLSQVLNDDHSCSDAVSRIIAHRAASGLGTVRQTRPATATPGAASSPASCAPWHGEPPRSYRPRPRSSGSGTGGMYSSPTGHTSPCRTRRRTGRATHSRRPRKPGIGFPLARLTVLLSLATGACHDLAIAPYKGKGTGETTLLREMYDSLKPR